MSDHYKQSGVDIAKGDAVVDWLKEGSAGSSPLGSLVGGIGGFSGLFKPSLGHMAEPLLVSATDGIGTKILLGLDQGRVEGLGIDLVAMCLNDLYTLGARGLFFLDYFATGLLDDVQFKQVLGGVKWALEQCQTALIGGETAELPGLYKPGHFDMAGFVVGAVDGKKMLGPHRVKAGDRLVALPSSGFHSNGYSLIRKWIAENSVSDQDLIGKLLQPTRLYHSVADLADRCGVDKIHAAAHITGGGLSGNLIRVLPEGCCAQISRSALKTPEWMRDFICQNVEDIFEVEEVFNLGVGMVLSVAGDALTEVMESASELGVEVYEFGAVTAGEKAVKYVD